MTEENPTEGGRPRAYRSLPGASSIPPDLPPFIAETIIVNEYKYAKIGLIIGGLVAFAGAVMIIIGITGPVDLNFAVGSTNIHLKTAVVGIAMAVIGALIILLTRPKLIWAKK